MEVSPTSPRPMRISFASSRGRPERPASVSSTRVGGLDRLVVPSRSISDQESPPADPALDCRAGISHEGSSDSETPEAQKDDFGLHEGLLIAEGCQRLPAVVRNLVITDAQHLEPVKLPDPGRQGFESCLIESKEPQVLETLDAGWHVFERITPTGLSSSSFFSSRNHSGSDCSWFPCKWSMTNAERSRTRSGNVTNPNPLRSRIVLPVREHC